MDEITVTTEITTSPKSMVINEIGTHYYKFIEQRSVWPSAPTLRALPGVSASVFLRLAVAWVQWEGQSCFYCPWSWATLRCEIRFICTCVSCELRGRMGSGPLGSVKQGWRWWGLPGQRSEGQRLSATLEVFNQRWMKYGSSNSRLFTQAPSECRMLRCS